MKLQLSIIPFFVFSLFISFQAEAQFNFSQKERQPTISLNYSIVDFTARSKFPSPLFTSVSLPSKEPFKYPSQFSIINATYLSDYSSNNSIMSQNKNMSLNRRLKYSSLWAFTSLNYLYADLVGLMDLNLLSQYQTGIVNGVEITPGFLTAAAAYMQIPLSNVFLPHVIKNDKTLRWVQIVSGSIATIVQGATLFVGKPSPYYILFSVIEIGVTSYITLDAIKWKVGKNKKPKKLF